MSKKKPVVKSKVEKPVKLTEVPAVIAGGIDVSGQDDDLQQRIEAAKQIASKPPQEFIENGIELPSTENVAVVGSVEAAERDVKLDAAIRYNRSIYEKTLTQYQQVYNIYKGAGNFNRDTAILVANRLSAVYNLPIVFDNTSGLFIYWDANAKSNRTLDIFGGFGVTGIGDLANRNRFATYFNFGSWSLNIYDPLVSIVKNQLILIDSLNEEQTYVAMRTLMKLPNEVKMTVLNILKEIK